MQVALRLFHIIINTHSTWLHGDERGFRSREHRIHSSGDYRNPPHADEHERLHRYQLQHSAAPTILSADAFAVVGNAIVNNLNSRGHEVEVACVSPTHAHQLALLPDDFEQIKTIIGWAKRFATRTVRERLEALREVEIWAEGVSITAVRDDSHRANARNYILTKQGADAWTYSKENGPSWQTPVAVRPDRSG